MGYNVKDSEVQRPLIIKKRKNYPLRHRVDEYSIVVGSQVFYILSDIKIQQPFMPGVFDFISLQSELNPFDFDVNTFKLLTGDDILYVLKLNDRYIPHRRQIIRALGRALDSYTIYVKNNIRSHYLNQVKVATKILNYDFEQIDDEYIIINMTTELGVE